MFVFVFMFTFLVFVFLLVFMLSFALLWLGLVRTERIVALNGRLRTGGQTVDSLDPG